MILIRFIKYYFKYVVRQIYWLFKLNKSDIHRTVHINFPIQREGLGVMTMKENGELGRFSNFGIAKNAQLHLGENNSIGPKSTIIINENSVLHVGSNFKLGEGSRLFVDANWRFGDDVKIETNCSIFSRESGFYGGLVIGNGTHIGDGTIIDVTDDIFIGEEVALGPNCIVYTHDHDFTNSQLAAWKGGVHTKKITIHDGAWIGSGVTILPGITIGNKSVVAAGSVVTKDVKANSVYAGIPAKLIKEIL